MGRLQAFRDYSKSQLQTVKNTIAPKDSNSAFLMVFAVGWACVSLAGYYNDIAIFKVMGAIYTAFCCVALLAGINNIQ